MSNTIMSPNALPTPGPSTEILGKLADSTNGYGSFSLPPAAIGGHATDSNATTSPSPATSDSSYRPLSPPQPANNRTEKPPVVTRRRSSANSKQAPNMIQSSSGYVVPPPPTRSRKIIQMKPQVQQEGPNQGSKSIGTANAKSQNTSPAISASGSKTNPPAAAGTKRKSGGGPSTAAGRKTARKTAHSLIERRRRSKMNEEFGVLKDMIPACTGQEMHKLAILQASIDYMRYLEQCLTDLKAAHSQCDQKNKPSVPSPPALANSAPRPTANNDPRLNTQEEDSESDPDEEMSEATSPQTMDPRYYHQTANNSVHSNQPSISPGILPSTLTSPAISANPRDYSYHSSFSSAQPSPGFESQIRSARPSFSTFKLTSPALGPQDSNGGEVKNMEKGDAEATAALLMLNTDRRTWNGNGPSRGMSVKDLLSG